MPHAGREHRLAYDRARNKVRNMARVGQKQRGLAAMAHRIESQRDLAGYLRKRGNLHMHWRRCGDTMMWHLVYENHTPVCETERCTMIPLTIA